ncbi:MAG: hypothetical protein WHX53_09365 [Anaerolineae bacterium]
MKRWILSISFLTLAAVLLAACGAAPQAAANTGATAGAATSLDTSYPNALPIRNQLLLGTLRLDDSAYPLSPAQAAALLPLWQGIRGTMNSGAAAQAETDALLRQIEANLTAEQLATIRGWQLTQADLQAWASSRGLSVGTGSGAGSGVPGSGQNLSPEARATRQAERGGTGESGGLSKALVDAVIAHLEAKKAN